MTQNLLAYNFNDIMSFSEAICFKLMFQKSVDNFKLVHKNMLNFGFWGAVLDEIQGTF